MKRVIKVLSVSLFVYIVIAEGPRPREPLPANPQTTTGATARGTMADRLPFPVIFDAHYANKMIAVATRVRIGRDAERIAKKST